MRCRDKLVRPYAFFFKTRQTPRDGSETFLSIWFYNVEGFIPELHQGYYLSQSMVLYAKYPGIAYDTLYIILGKFAPCSVLRTPFYDTYYYRIV